MMNSASEPEMDVEVEDNDHSQPIKSGWLSKQGGAHKNIKKRWFVLTKNALKYYKTDKLGTPLGIIYLRRVSTVQKPQDSGGYFSFEITTPERTYLIMAFSSDELDAWVTAIEQVVSRQKDTKANNVIKSGYLTKQGGGFKSWKRRWFVLTGDNLLSYFHEQGDVVPLGTIDLEKCLDAKLTQETQKGFGFELITPDRTYSIIGGSKEEVEGWMHILLDIVGNVVDGSSPLRVPDDDDEGNVSADEITNFIRLDTKIIKEGFLVKQGGKIKTWKRRWFVLRESTLAYYKEQKDDKPIGLISLKDCKSFELASAKVNKPYAFEISTPERIYVCSAKDEDEMWDWINVLSTAVTKAGGKESFEFIALKKASELAAQKKALQFQIYRKATAKNFHRKIARYRNNQNKQPISARRGEDAKWTKQVKANNEGGAQEPSNEVEAQEQKMLDDLEKLTTKNQKSDLTKSIRLMEKDIAQLNNQLAAKEGGEPSALEDLDDDIIEQARKQEKGGFLCYARAIMDFNPNAYDAEALGFSKGDLLLVENKAASGNWKGKIVKKSPDGKSLLYSESGTFPYRYVEEIDDPEELENTSRPQGEKKEEWNEQLDNAVETLFDMYDSDGDGFITKLDFFEFLYEFGKTYLTDKQVDKCWDTLDKDKTGKVDANAFREGVRVLDQLDFYSDWSA